MGINSYYGGMERLKSASKLYYNEFKRDYLDDFILIHQALGLSMVFNKTYVILNLVSLFYFVALLRFGGRKDQKLQNSSIF